MRKEFECWEKKVQMQRCQQGDLCDYRQLPVPQSMDRGACGGVRKKKGKTTGSRGGPFPFHCIAFEGRDMSK